MPFMTLMAIVILTIATVNSIILITKPHKTGYDLRMLGVTLLFYTIFLLTFFLWFQAGYILYFPHMLRTVSPLMYLSGPFFYFYVRNTLLGNKGLTKMDFVHFIPALLHFIDLIPFYLLSTEEKLEMSKMIVADLNSLNWIASGVIDIAFHYVLRLILLLGYYFYSLYLLTKRYDFASQFSMIWRGKNWFVLSFYLTGFLIIGHAGHEFFNYLILKNLLSLDFIPLVFAYITIAGLFLMNISINFRPEYIFQLTSEGTGRSHAAPISKPKASVLVRANVFQENGDGHWEEVQEEKDLEVYREKLLSFVQNQKVFTSKGISLPQFSKEIGLSQKTVSAAIHHISGKRFNDWINTYRIAMAVEKIEDGYLDDYTLESLGDLVGFNSRTTFFNAFKKEKGCSPSEYWVRFQDNVL